MKTTAKVLPHNSDAEQSTLGCVMVSPNSQIDIFHTLSENDFYSESHKKIFGEMVTLYGSNKPIDLITLVDQLERKNLLDAVGGVDYLSLISSSMPTAANYKHYVDIVKRDSILRQLINASQQIIDKSFDGNEHDHIMEYAEKAIFDIAQNQDKSNLTPIKETAPEIMAKFNEIEKDPSILRGLKTGFVGLDSLTNGLQNSDLILLAARQIGRASCRERV